MDRRFSAGACVAMIIAGCTVGPDYHRREVHVPQQWFEPHDVSNAPTTQPSTTQPTTIQPASAPASDLSQWWRTFGDPRLDSLIQRAVSSNLELRIAQARIREARAQRKIVAADLYPVVGSKASYLREHPSDNSPQGRLVHQGPANILGLAPGDLDYEQYDVGFDAAWELDLFGGVRRRVEAADANTQAAIEDERDVLISVAAEVARNYIELRAAQRRLAIAQEDLATRRTTLDLVLQKRRAGTVTELDVTRAQAQVSLSESFLPVYIRQIHLSIHALSVLLPGEIPALTQELQAPVPLPANPAPIPAGLPAELLRRRPDIRHAERVLAAATAQIGVATADLYPRVSLSGTFSMEATKFAWMGNWDSRMFGFGPAVRWPVFDGGRIRANIRMQDARQEQAMAQYERVVVGAVREVEDALVTHATERDRHRSLAETVASSREAVELAQISYEQGATDLLAVLDAERTLYTALDALVQADQTGVLSLVALYKALGGGWSIDSPEPPSSQPAEATTQTD